MPKEVNKQTTKTKKKELSSSAPSGAVGGPGTGRISYQVDAAIWRALQAISEAALLPLTERYISVEPRLISEGSTTTWDIGLKPDDEIIEVKFNVTRKDIKEWLERIATAAPSATTRFGLLYNNGTNSLLRCVDQMRRIAGECRTEGEEKFKFLVKAEGIGDVEEVFGILGQNAYALLQRVRIEHVPEPVLQTNIKMAARLLAGIEGGKQLYRLLFDKFSHAVSGRLTFSISELLNEVQSDHIQIHVPPAAILSDYDPLITSTIFLLQSCATGVPIDVVAHAVSSDRESLLRILDPLLHDGKIVMDGDSLFVVGVQTLAYADGEEILARALEDLLRYLKIYSADQLAFAQIHNAMALAKQCAVVRPRCVVPVFHTLDKLLKRTGNLNSVLEVANLTISAAKRVEPRGAEEAAAVAIALVCGISWAYQRMPGRLDDARSAYMDSKGIAESIDDKTTLAYISKCLGRLCRIEAEQVDINREVAESKLRESLQLLQEAIDQFDALGGYSQEIADCYSLMARTYLTMREFAKLEQAMRKAYSLMENLQSKDYADLLILNGDFEVTRRNYSSAHLSYNKVLDLRLDNGAEWSEIRARALRQRGLCFLKSGKPLEAKPLLLQAAEIWHKLDQNENAAAARWEIMLIDNDFPSEALQLLHKESLTVRVEFGEIYLNRLSERATKKVHLASREQQDKAYFERLIKKARQQNAIRNLND